MENKDKIIIYQVFTRLFGNNNSHCIANGTIQENGCGKMADFTAKALGEIKDLGATHIWYTGVIEHATQTDYRRHGITPDHPAVVKGKAGSPYAIKDYYDIDPDLAKDVPERMKEFENLVQRTHKAGLKVAWAHHTDGSICLPTTPLSFSSVSVNGTSTHLHHARTVSNAHWKCCCVAVPEVLTEAKEREIHRNVCRGRKRYTCRYLWIE